MARKGKVPISIPTGVEVKIDDSCVSVKGPKGELKQDLISGIKIVVEDQNVIVAQESEDVGNFHGLMHTLVNNMIIGTTKGYEKRLTMIGVGFRANVQGKNLNLLVGFSHPTMVEIPEGINIAVEKNTTLIISGIDKQKVGQFASTIRAIRPPEPYKGKGIRYENEYVRRKAGKAAAKK